MAETEIAAARDRTDSSSDGSDPLATNFGGAMYVTIVHVHVKPERVEDFVEAIGLNHEGSVKEPGNLRFDILQSVEDPTRFIAYEAYRDEAAAKAHKETAHYLAWRDKVTDWMAEPRVGVRYDGLFPSES